MIKNYNRFILENNNKDISTTKDKDGFFIEKDVDIDPQIVLDNLKNKKMNIDFRMPKDSKPFSERFINDKMDYLYKMLQRKIESYKPYVEKHKKEYRISELPFNFFDAEYQNPISGEYGTFILISPNDITLARLERIGNDFKYKELDVPETLIHGNFYTFEINIPSGKMCFGGDIMYNVFVDNDSNDDIRYSNNYHRVEKDAITHINHYLDNGYFYVPDCFYPTMTKKDNQYIISRLNIDDYNGEFGDIIQHISIESDHSMIIIDNDLLNDKIKQNKEKYDKISKSDLKYFKYCLDVEPGKYKIDFNWRFGKIKEDDTLVYFIIEKIS